MEIFVHFIKFRMRYYDKSSSVSMSVTKQQKCYKIAKKCMSLPQNTKKCHVNKY